MFEWCNTLGVIPGRDEVASPEFITTIPSIDSGLALRAPRNGQPRLRAVVVIASWDPVVMKQSTIGVPVLNCSAALAMAMSVFVPSP